MTSPVITPSDRNRRGLDDIAAVPLPATRRTGRAHQRRMRKRRQRRRMTMRGSAVLVVVLGIALIGRIAAGPSRNQGADGAGGTAAAVGPPALLLVQRDDANRAVSLFVLAPAPNRKGGTLLLIPPGTMAEAASLGLQPLTGVLELGGPEALQTTVQNLLGAPVADVHMVDGAGFAAMVTPAAPLTVKIPERVERVDEAKNVHVVFAPGPTRIDPAEVPALLAEKGQGTDLSRLARHQAFWDAWLAEVKEREAALPPEPPALRAALAALAAGELRTRVLPVTSLSTGGEVELYQVQRAELSRLASAMFPGAPTVAGARPRIQILNGTGEPGLGRRVVEKMGAPFDVRLTGNASRFDYAETHIVFYDRKQQPAAERVREALGVGKLVFSRHPLDVVDVTIIVGKDLQ
jgi:hypothetical protein